MDIKLRHKSQLPLVGDWVYLLQCKTRDQNSLFFVMTEQAVLACCGPKRMDTGQYTLHTSESFLTNYKTQKKIFTNLDQQVTEKIIQRRMNSTFFSNIDKLIHWFGVFCGSWIIWIRIRCYRNDIWWTIAESNWI